MKKILKNEIEKLEKWLYKNYPEIFKEQKHCDGGTVERVYWHYGRLIAFVDMKRWFTRKKILSNILNEPDELIERAYKIGYKDGLKKERK